MYNSTIGFLWMKVRDGPKDFSSYRTTRYAIRLEGILLIIYYIYRSKYKDKFLI